MIPIGEGLKATKRYGFYDGVAKILAYRILDFVLFKALCGSSGLTLVSPSSAMEVGSMTFGVVREKAGLTEALWLKGMPDCGIIMGRHRQVVVVVVENKSSPLLRRPLHPGLGQLCCYVMIAQLGHVGESLEVPVIGILMAPDVLYKVMATWHGNTININVEKVGNLMEVVREVWRTLAAQQGPHHTHPP